MEKDYDLFATITNLVLVRRRKNMADNKLKEIDCSPECGFMIRSHNEHEVVQMATQHVKEAHHKNPSEQDMKKSMRII